ADRVRQNLGKPRGEVGRAGPVRVPLSSPPASKYGAQPIAGPVGAHREMRLDTELERNGDSPVRAGDRAKAIVHGVAERLGGGIESADVQEHRIGRGAEAPAVEVGRAVQPLVEPAEQVHRDEREREPAVEPEPVWSPVELQVERWLPGAGARVARGDRAELAGEAALDGGRGTRERRAHGARDGGISGDGGMEHEGAVLARAV